MRGTNNNNVYNFPEDNSGEEEEIKYPIFRYPTSKDWWRLGYLGGRIHQMNQQRDDEERRWICNVQNSSSKHVALEGYKKVINDVNLDLERHQEEMRLESERRQEMAKRILESERRQKEIDERILESERLQEKMRLESERRQKEREEMRLESERRQEEMRLESERRQKEREEMRLESERRQKERENSRRQLEKDEVANSKLVDGVEGRSEREQIDGERFHLSGEREVQQRSIPSVENTETGLLSRYARNPKACGAVVLGAVTFGGIASALSWNFAYNGLEMGINTISSAMIGGGSMGMLVDFYDNRSASTKLDSHVQRLEDERNVNLGNDNMSLT